MPVQSKAMVRLASTPVAAGRVLTVWGYATADAKATVETAGYFNNAKADKDLQKGDQILAAMVIDGSTVAAHYVVTNLNSGGNVTIALAAVS